MTRVLENFESDAHFPEIDENEWEEVSREAHLDHKPPFEFRTLERRG